MQKWYRIFCEADGAGGGEGTGIDGTGGAGEGGGAPAGTGDAGAAGGATGGGEAGAAQGEGTKNVFEMGGDQVPAEYEFNLGEGLEISDELKAQFSAVAKSAKMTQSQADALMKMHSDVMLDAIKQAEDQRNGWAAECEKQGLISPENIGYARAAVDTFGGSEVMQVLVQTGAANHPAVLKMLQTIGSMIAEDKVPDGQQSKPQQGNTADILFANSKY